MECNFDCSQSIKQIKAIRAIQDLLVESFILHQLIKRTATLQVIIISFLLIIFYLI